TNGYSGKIRDLLIHRPLLLINSFSDVAQFVDKQLIIPSIIRSDVSYDLFNQSVKNDANFVRISKRLQVRPYDGNLLLSIFNGSTVFICNEKITEKVAKV